MNDVSQKEKASPETAEQQTNAAEIITPARIPGMALPPAGDVFLGRRITPITRRRIENFTEVQRQVYEALDQVVRASSAVECFNSVLRPYVSVKKHLSQGFLALIALYHNTHSLPQRGHQTPLQLADVDLGDDDWVRLIEHEMRYGQAAAAQGK